MKVGNEQACRAGTQSQDCNKKWMSMLTELEPSHMTTQRK